MRIAHILSGSPQEGRFFAAAALAAEEVKRGHTTLLIAPYQSDIRGVESTLLPIGKYSIFGFLKSLRGIIRLANRRGIDVLHAHSREAAEVARIVAGFTGCGFVATLHVTDNKKLPPAAGRVYGDHVIAVCEEIRDEEVRRGRIAAQKITVIRNGIC